MCSSDLDEVLPKNILMMGPTGVGKTEISRRLSKLAEAPFVKVEATNIKNNAIIVKEALSNCPIISVGFVKSLSTEIKFFSKTILEPKTKKIARNEYSVR